ncbi:hypothetical protein Clacol_006460 [Clathrus columnatus]|uniref:Uncharacterized protein n=1 Tax=Clathrus columnatus TaxID=1419009 RepID=A0AAV5AHR5_9AGAM|nr:hypothetical protein Clacol_006460 [Clathrus columnatus]
MPDKTGTTKTSTKRRKSANNSIPSKKRKLQTGAYPSGKGKPKQRAYEKDTIPIPDIPESDEEFHVSEDDIDFFRESVPTFLTNLDTKAISRQVVVKPSLFLFQR